MWKTGALKTTPSDPSASSFPGWTARLTTVFWQINGVVDEKMKTDTVARTGNQTKADFVGQYQA